MRAILQRVSRADVTVGGEVVGSINRGFLILLGVTHGDSQTEISFLTDKIIGLRVFEDEEGKMNLSLEQVQGEALVVSQFTLYGDCRKGRRPSFTDAAPPGQADELYQLFVEALRSRGIKVETGSFGEKMQVSLVNDGPVTFILDTAKKE